MNSTTMQATVLIDNYMYGSQVKYVIKVHKQTQQNRKVRQPYKNN